MAEDFHRSLIQPTCFWMYRCSRVTLEEYIWNFLKGEENRGDEPHGTSANYDDWGHGVLSGLAERLS